MAQLIPMEKKMLECWHAGMLGMLDGGSEPYLPYLHASTVVLAAAAAEHIQSATPPIAADCTVPEQATTSYAGQQQTDCSTKSLRTAFGVAAGNAESSRSSARAAEFVYPENQRASCRRRP